MNTSSLDAVLQQAVDSGAVPNVTAVAADRDGVVYEGAAGPRIAGGDEAVTVDTRYRIMSMTKMVATAAALQLVEEGQLDLDAPVASYRPEFADLQVLEGFDGDTPRLRAPKTQATVKQLITHTAGLGYWFFNADLVRWEAATGTANVLSGSNVVFTAPLVADPGSRLEYGINTDWLGKVIEAAGGVTLDVAVKDGITGPLGMDATSFAPSGDDRKNLVPVHLKGEDGWAASEIELAAEPEYWAGGHGLHSTPRDYLRFQRALLGGGAVDGVRILSEATSGSTGRAGSPARSTRSPCRSSRPRSTASTPTSRRRCTPLSRSGPGRGGAGGRRGASRRRPPPHAAASARPAARVRPGWRQEARRLCGGAFPALRSCPPTQPRSTHMGFLDSAKDLAGKAQDLAADHAEQVKDGIDKVEGLADKATGGKFTSAIGGAGDKAANYVDGLDDKH